MTPAVSARLTIIPISTKAAILCARKAIGRDRSPLDDGPGDPPWGKQRVEDPALPPEDPLPAANDDFLDQATGGQPQ